MSIKEEFAYSLIGEIAEIFDNLDKLHYDNNNQFNNLLKTQIYFLSEKYNYRSIKNYSLEDNSGRFIDVIWISKNYNIVAAFLILDDFNDKVIGELIRLDSFCKFWIYYGEEEIPYAKKLINQHNVHIVRTHRKVKKVSYWFDENIDSIDSVYIGGNNKGCMEKQDELDKNKFLEKESDKE